ncbi:hydrolase [Lentibacillus saliphilus]|uniref:hydrolase n=1 Tax=Lentibacillus saliphilus TaxID=2737028 RepID=UPI001C2F8572|nr:hydrolase [Lentibacillus saliphilus]
MLTTDQTVFVLIDVQGKLARIVHESEAVIDSLKKLIKGLRILDVPIIWLEQYPQGLGATVEEIADELDGISPIEKTTFSACKNEAFMRELKATDRKHVLIAGIEAHVCVYQTAKDLNRLEYDVHLVKDAVSSRTPFNKQIGIEAMEEAGITGTSVEMALYELMGEAGTDTFKRILQIIK